MRTIGIIVLSALAFGLLLGYSTGYMSSSVAKWSDAKIDLAELKKKEKKQKQEAEESTDMSGPRVKLDNPIFDFGVLDKNEKTEKGEHDFVIENAGGSALTLKEGGKGCMCTSFSISHGSIKKGEKATVKVKWDGSRGGGVFDQSVRVSTNDPAMKEIYLTVKGLYTAPVIAYPNQIMFSGVSSSAETTRSFRLFGFTKKGTDGKPFSLEIQEASISHPEFFTVKLEKGKLDDMSEDEKQHKLFQHATSLYNGTLVMKPGLPQGSFQEVMRVKTNDPQLPVLEMMVEGQITGAITLSGNRYDRLNSGHLGIGAVSSRQTTTENLRMTIFEKMIVTKETLKVSRVRPDWLKVNINYPDEELQKKLPVKIIDIQIVIPAGARQGNFMGPGKSQMGEVVFEVGPKDKPVTEMVVPIQFAVGP